MQVFKDSKVRKQGFLKTKDSNQWFESFYPLKAVYIITILS